MPPIENKLDGSMYPIENQLDDPISFGRFVGSIESRMIQTTWRITRNQADAEDAIQAALCIAWRRRAVLADHPNPVALMLKICIDASLDLLKKNRSTRKTLNSFAATQNCQNYSATNMVPASQVETNEAFAALILEIERLPPKVSQAILMRLVDETPYPEIAAALECTEVAARKYVQRGRETLQTRLRQKSLDAFAGESR
jgi:RNA polymerase sigma-70 factor, ECF subfamily